MKTINYILSIAMLATMGASAAVYHAVDFDTVTETLNAVNTSSGKIRFGGNTAPAETVSTNEWAGNLDLTPPPDPGKVNIIDDGTGTNNVLYLNGQATKTISTALVVAPEKFGGTASVARVSFDLTFWDNKGAGDASDGYLKVYAASGYDLSGATDARIIIQCSAQASGGSYIVAQNGATLTALASKQFIASDVGSTVSLDFDYDGSSAIIVLWESQNKTGFKFDNVQFTDDGVVTALGDSSIVFFGGDAGIFGGDSTTNNLFVGQTGAGEIVQWNGVDSDGGSFGSSGTLVDQGIGGALTNTANGLVLTTVGILPSGSNSFASSVPNILGVDGGDPAKFDVGEAWTFEFNKQVQLKQLVLSGLGFDGETVQVTVDGVDTNSFTRVDANMTNVLWEASSGKYVYTYPSPITVPAGTQITIDATSGQWGLQGMVVDVPYIDFGGNSSFVSNATYKAEMGGDTIVAWFGDDSAGRTNGIGNLANAGVGATLSAADYGVTMTTLAIESSNPARTNTVQSGGQLGINFAGSFNASFEAVDDTEWTFEFNKNVLLSKVSFNGFDGSDEAEIIIGGVTNLITPVDTVAATYETRSIYTFPDSVPIAAGTDITIRAPAGKWGLRTLLVGLDAASAPEVSYAAWAGTWGVDLGSATANFDSDALNNYGEYVFGGNPTNANDIGTQPTFDGTSGTYSFSLIGDNTVTAYVLTNLDLVFGSWGTNSTINVSNTDGVLSNYTDNVGTGPDNLFIKLLVE